MPGGIDHIVPVAHDLDKLAEFYRGLGFKVGARNRHDWGTLNHIVQFDGCFIELLTTEPGFKRPPLDEPIAQFTEPLANYLDRKEGIAMCVLEAHDAAADQAHFTDQAIAGPSPFFFERKGKRPDGSDVHVSFSLAFARMSGFGNGGFFVCQQHNPDAFWSPDFQDHPNGAKGIAGVAFVAEDVAHATDFFTRYSGQAAQRCDADHARIQTARGWIDILSPAAAVDRYGGDQLASPAPEDGFAALHIACDDVGALAKFAEASGTPSRQSAGRCVIAANRAFGTTLVFEQVD